MRSARSQLLREALGLWRGPPLGDLAFESFAQGEIRRLEELRLQALEERIDADLELGGGGELIGELEGLVAEHPLRERLRGQLMLSLYRAGRQAEALQAYQDARRTLVDELGHRSEPGAAAALPVDAPAGGGAGASAPQHCRRGPLRDVVRAFLAGRLVLVLGAGVNHPENLPENGLPSPVEVAAHLARSFDCPPAHAHDLAHVAEYVALTKGVGPLYDELHTLFDRDGPRSDPSDAGRVGGAAASARRIASVDRHDQLRRRARAGVSGGRRGVRRRLLLALGPNRGSSSTSAPTVSPLSSRSRTPTPTSRSSAAR